MSKFVLAMMAASSLTLFGTAALAVDHHMAGEVAAPTHETCMALHQELMAGVAEDDTAARDAVMAGLDVETSARVETCHAMMHAEPESGGAAEAPEDGAHTAGHGHDHAAPVIPADGEREQRQADMPQK